MCKAHELNTLFRKYVVSHWTLGCSGGWGAWWCSARCPTCPGYWRSRRRGRRTGAFLACIGCKLLLRTIGQLFQLLELSRKRLCQVTTLLWNRWSLFHPLSFSIFLHWNRHQLPLAIQDLISLLMKTSYRILVNHHLLACQGQIIPFARFFLRSMLTSSKVFSQIINCSNFHFL